MVELLNGHIADGRVKPGDIFGRLIVIEKVAGCERRWHCKCVCGTMVEHYQTELIRKKTVSCGCIKNTELAITMASLRPSHRRKDLTGQVFNFLTALKLMGLNSAGNTIWLFKCLCGKEISRTGRQVTRGDITSCGCKKRELLRKANTLPDNKALKNSAYRVHLKCAEKRNLISYLSKEEYESLIILPCYYCESISQRKYTERKTTAPLNSVDRLNNEPYYKPENSVSACFECQKAKGVMKAADFVAMCKCVSELWKDK